MSGETRLVVNLPQGGPILTDRAMDLSEVSIKNVRLTNHNPSCRNYVNQMSHTLVANVQFFCDVTTYWLLAGIEYEVKLSREWVVGH